MKHKTSNILEMTAFESLWGLKPDRLSKRSVNGFKKVVVAEYDEMGDAQPQDIKVCCGDRCVPLLPLGDVLHEESFEFVYYGMKRKIFQKMKEEEENESSRSTQKSV